jgi:hypothetical protein
MEWESWTHFLAIDQKIPPQALHGKELALVGKAETHLTVL